MTRVRLGAVAGICGAVLFTCGWILAGILQPDSYSWASQEISDLGALTAEHAWVWNLGLSWHHQAHDIESLAVFVAILTAPFAIARALRGIEHLRGLQTCTLATGLVRVAATVAYALLYGEAGGGTAQRLLALAFMAWITVLATSAFKEKAPAALRR